MCLAVPSTDTYFLRVAAKNLADVIAPYVLMVAVSTGTPAGEEEPNDTVPTANPLWMSVSGSLSSAADVDWYCCHLMDAGMPFIIVDGDPERDGSCTDVVLDFQMDMGGTFPTVNSSSGAGQPWPPAEAVVLPDRACVRVSEPHEGTYVILANYTGYGVPVPVELMSLEIR